MARFIEYSDDQLNQLLEDVHAGRIDPANLPLDLYLAIQDKLTGSLFAGFGGDFQKFEDDAVRLNLLEHYTHNIAVFSGAKTHQQVNDMTKLILNNEGIKRPFEDFRRDVLALDDPDSIGIFDNYNDNWLRTEFDTAFGQAQSGDAWADIQENKETLPLLQYKTAGDERVRTEHAAWNNVTLPVDDPFWKTHMPLNGFNCRCRVIQLEADEAPVTDQSKVKDLPDPDSPLFKQNVGINKTIFDETKHDYFKVEDRFKVDLGNNFGLPTPPKPDE